MAKEKGLGSVLESTAKLFEAAGRKEKEKGEKKESGLAVLLDNTANLFKALAVLHTTDVMVGVPSEKAGRSSPINNASLAYIHDKGAPEANIPARPFMEPGVESVHDKIEDGLEKAADFALEGKPVAVERELNRVGMIGRDAIKSKIGENIPPPLKLGTVLGRIRRRKGKKWRAERRAQVDANVASGADPGAGIFTALIDTGQLRNSISYVLRKEK